MHLRGSLRTVQYKIAQTVIPPLLLDVLYEDTANITLKRSGPSVEFIALHVLVSKV